MIKHLEFSENDKGSKYLLHGKATFRLNVDGGIK
jgi:hypothetical protein